MSDNRLDNQSKHKEKDAHSRSTSPVGAWQPIAYAPKRRKVLVSFVNDFGKRRTVCACYFDPGQLDMDDAPDELVDEEGKNTQGGWFEDCEMREPAYWPLDKEPTHFMPLPAPPLAKAQSAGEAPMNEKEG